MTLVSQAPAAVTAPSVVVARPVPGRRRRHPFATPGVLASVAVVLVILGWALVPGLFTAADPLVGVPAEKLSAPSAEHWFGTDNLGRDLYARTVHGTGLSLQAALLALGLGLAVGALVGLVAGYLGGAVDAVLMRTTDVLLAIPGLLLSLAVVTALGFGTLKVAIAVGVAEVATFARVMRSEVLRVRTTTYVEAAVLAGARRSAVLARHVLPNAAAPILVLATVQLGVIVLAVSSLSFLGFGAVPPTPEWGSLVAEGRNYLSVAWWFTTLPGLVIAALVLAANRLGRLLEGRAHR
ncbi:ABC transporter permease [Cellulomonas sp. Root485]|uniref:ABC transporter permease n=1 Tax=Cellulomonas sp. Root485 TaxID=1736546 RepID=UPI0009EC005F|nr:ABC transporter permease [Cellulomonas sp. Root485]